MADLLGHEGPVWQVAWGHPKFGALLASASFDHRVIVWKEGPDGAWSQVCIIMSRHGCKLGCWLRTSACVPGCCLRLSNPASSSSIRPDSCAKQGSKAVPCQQ